MESLQWAIANGTGGRDFTREAYHRAFRAWTKRTRSECWSVMTKSGAVEAFGKVAKGVGHPVYLYRVDEPRMFALVMHYAGALPPLRGMRRLLRGRPEVVAHPWAAKGLPPYSLEVLGSGIESFSIDSTHRKRDRLQGLIDEGTMWSRSKSVDELYPKIARRVESLLRELSEALSLLYGPSDDYLVAVGPTLWRAHDPDLIRKVYGRELTGIKTSPMRRTRGRLKRAR